jgi:hypothetical protein
MNKPGRYDAHQWAMMNGPEGQKKIRDGLFKYLRSFLDTAPEDKPLERVQQLLTLVKRYFEDEVQELSEGRPDDLERIELQTSMETVVMALEGAMLMVPTDESRREQFDSVLKEFMRSNPA